MTAPLDVAIVGAGLMGRWHARYAAAEGARVAAIVDTRSERASELARRFPGARAFSDLGECLRAGSIQVVHVCAHTGRVPLAVEALESGCHVLVEKPAACSEREADRLLEAAGARGLRVCPVHQFGFQRGFRRVLRERSRLGALVRVAGTVCSGGGLGRPSAERRLILAGMVPHFLSLFRALTGPLPPSLWRVLAATEDDLELLARRAEVTLSLSLSLRGRPPRNELVVVGTEATAHVDLFHGFGWLESRPASRWGKAKAPFVAAGTLAAAATGNLLGRALRGERAFPGLRALVGAFYRSLREGGEPPLSAAELRETAACLEYFSSSHQGT